MVLRSQSSSEPLDLATCGYRHSGRVRPMCPLVECDVTTMSCSFAHDLKLISFWIVKRYPRNR